MTEQTTDEELYAELMDIDLSDKSEDEEDILLDYYKEVDSNLRSLKWGYKPAKSNEEKYNFKTDQSLLNHTRNGVTFLSQLQNAVQELGREFTNEELRKSIALFVVHDLHKLEENEVPEKEFNIEREKVENLVKESGLNEFADIDIEDYYASAKATHFSENAKSGRMGSIYGQLAPFVRLADGVASSPTPEDACGGRNQEILENQFSNLGLRHHRIKEEKGIFTNLINKSVSDYLESRGYQSLAFYPNGCLYITEKSNEKIESNQEVFSQIYDILISNLQKSHGNLENPEQMTDAIKFINNLGYYKPNTDYYFYAGLDSVVEAFLHKGVQQGEGGDPTESMIEDIEQTSEAAGTEIPEDKKIIGWSRAIAGIYLQIGKESGWNLDTVFEIFNVSEEVQRNLKSTDIPLKGNKVGNKWLYAIPIAHEFLESDIEGEKVANLDNNKLVGKISAKIIDNLDDNLESKLIGDFEDEVRYFLSDTLVINGQEFPKDDSLFDSNGFDDRADPFREYKQATKICSNCNRTTFGYKGDMKSTEGPMTGEKGFSNFKQVGAKKPTDFILCTPCQIEYGLRKIDSGNEANYSRFIHLIPDYFFTPESYKIAENIITYLGNGPKQVRESAKSIVTDEFIEELEEVVDILEPTDNDAEFSASSFNFSNSYGSNYVKYERNTNSTLNKTSVDFLSSYIGLLTSELTGSRVLISNSPLNTNSGFNDMIKLDSAEGVVSNVAGQSISIKSSDVEGYESEMEARLKAFASLIRIGYGIEKKDSLFAKYIRACNNNDLPGSKLLKMLERSLSSDEKGIVSAYLDEAEILDEILGDTMTKDKLDRLSELGYQIAIPSSYKNHAVEKPFRDAVKAITSADNDLSKTDYKNLVSGKLQKGLDRTKQTYSESKEDLDTEKNWGERVEEFADFFVEEILYDLCDGNPGKLKRKSNNYADAYYAGVIRRKNSN
ncbi:MAG: type I-D CRISPR-associated protein Cas10d/Csc3 [Candidatus Nanohaloarchaea archaeon]